MRYTAVSEEAPAEKLIKVNDATGQKTFPIVGKGEHYLGYVTIEDVKKYEAKTPQGLKDVTSGQILIEIFPGDPARALHVHPDDSPGTALGKMIKHNLEFIPIVDDENVLVGTADLDFVRKLIK